MNFQPTRTNTYLPYFFIFLFLFILSCSKDSDILRDAVLNEDEISVDEKTQSDYTDEAEQEIEDESLEETDNESEVIMDEVTGDNSQEENVTEEFENRVTSFPAIQDVYIQNGIGYNEEIVRLQQNLRSSYLQFDLSEIHTIQGTITAAVLEFIVDSDHGNGTIELYKGNSNSWSESNLTLDNVPEVGSLLATNEQSFKVNEKVTIPIEVTDLLPELATLILVHKNGNDFAFASKENKYQLGPRLLVFYASPVSAPAIEIEELQIIEERPAVEGTETTQEEQNNAPNAIAEANVLTGIKPLVVLFTGNKSSDDKGITNYSWNFKDGSMASIADPTHTFVSAGTYSVDLIVTDEEGLSHKDTKTIRVNEPPNSSPIAVATANTTSGVAPLQVNFMGSNSSDDKGVQSYMWNFKDGSTSNNPNPSNTFNSPGTYFVELIVQDSEGLSDAKTITITVNEETPSSNECITDGGMADETGLKTWCWADINVPTSTSTGRDSFSNGQLALSIECSANQVVKDGDKLKFITNPTSPAPASWCNNDFNFRSEIRTMPWNIDHPAGTEEWFGFSYGFGDSYIADPTNNWAFYQAHEGTTGLSPLISLQVNGRNTSSLATGEIVIVNASHQGTNNLYYGTDIVPKAGETVDVVLHVVWGDNNIGLLQVWLNGIKTLDISTRTVYASTNVGGNSKFGIYKSPWRNSASVQNSASEGVFSIETFMGPLRVITRRPGDANYKQNSYSTVSSRR